MKIAVEGCCHGELDATYDHIATLERRAGEGFKVELLLVCGDFQAVRNHADLQCMAVPQKYRKLGGFYKYYIGQKTAPVLTIVIGGNHEASNYMWELYHGGWLAPNIYFLGFSGCVQVNGIRIAGASGIYKPNHFNLGHYERVPYDNSSVRSIYHTRLYDIFKLSHLSPTDIFLSHDWPNTIEQHGDTQALLRRKPFFRQEAQTGTLGSPPLLDLLKTIKPHWWFSAHLHTKFEALYRHDGGDGDDLKPQQQQQPIDNPDEIKIDDDDIDGDDNGGGGGGNGDVPIPGESPSPPESGPSKPPQETRFLALDKCLPKRDFLEVVDVLTPESESGIPPRLAFDAEWLAITRALHPFLCTTREQATLPGAEEARALVAAELEWVRRNVGEGGVKDVGEVQTFWRTAPGPGHGDGSSQSRPPSWYTNPQTEAIARLLQIGNKVNPVPAGVAPPPMVQGMGAENAGEAAATTTEVGGCAASAGGVAAGGVEPPGVVGDDDDDEGGGRAGVSGGWSPSRVVD